MPFYVKSTNFWKKSIKGLAKFKWDDKNGHLVQIVIIKANLGKNGEYAKINQGFGKYSNEMTKSGMLTVGDFTRMTNLAK